MGVFAPSPPHIFFTACQDANQVINSTSWDRERERERAGFFLLLPCFLLKKILFLCKKEQEIEGRFSVLSRTHFFPPPLIFLFLLRAIFGRQWLNLCRALPISPSGNGDHDGGTISPVLIAHLPGPLCRQNCLMVSLGGGGRKHNEWLTAYFSPLPPPKNAVCLSYRWGRKCNFHLPHTHTHTNHTYFQAPPSPNTCQENAHETESSSRLFLKNYMVPTTLVFCACAETCQSDMCKAGGGTTPSRTYDVWRIGGGHAHEYHSFFLLTMVLSCTRSIPTMISAVFSIKNGPIRHFKPNVGSPELSE